MKRTALICTVFLLAVTASAQQRYWQQQLSYKIDVTLNDRDHTLDGFLELIYTNNSPDSLSFIWFHLWPNAFKNDRTAFSEQQLENGKTDFYFSGKEQKGYINRLDFRVNNTTLKVEDHPSYSDIVKVYLPAPLAPGAQTKITTPFHVKLPQNFSRGGHNGKDGQSYQVTQWYPKPAVYDRKGWHPMPYLQQGEFYSEFGNYDVRITLPDNYVVAATGLLQNAEELDRLRKGITPPLVMEAPKKGFGSKPQAKKTTATSQQKKASAKKKTVSKKKPASKKGRSSSDEDTLPADAEAQQAASVKSAGSIASSKTIKTLRYLQQNVHDFAWFADKYLGVQHDTIQLSSGRTVDVFAYYHASGAKTWKHSTTFVKDAVHFRSSQIGEYPYNVVSVVEMPMGFDGGMEYPTITSLSLTTDAALLDRTIGHEVGHNWFYGILATNERDHPWMDEGMNSFYDFRYKQQKYPELL